MLHWNSKYSEIKWRLIPDRLLLKLTISLQEEVLESFLIIRLHCSFSLPSTRIGHLKVLHQPRSTSSNCRNSPKNSNSHLVCEAVMLVFGVFFFPGVLLQAFDNRRLHNAGHLSSFHMVINGGGNNDTMGTANNEQWPRGQTCGTKVRVCSVEQHQILVTTGSWMAKCDWSLHPGAPVEEGSFLWFPI